MTQKAQFDLDVIQTHNLLTWRQTYYQCATTSEVTTWNGTFDWCYTSTQLKSMTRYTDEGFGPRCVFFAQKKWQNVINITLFAWVLIQRSFCSESNTSISSLKCLTLMWFEQTTFWSGVRCAIIAPQSLLSFNGYNGNLEVCYTNTIINSAGFKSELRYTEEGLGHHVTSCSLCRWYAHFWCFDNGGGECCY